MQQLGADVARDLAKYMVLHRDKRILLVLVDYSNCVLDLSSCFIILSTIEYFSQDRVLHTIIISDKRPYTIAEILLNKK